MCIAVPMQVVSVDGENAKVSLAGNLLDVNISLVDAKAGDYVLVHAGCAIEIVDTDTAKEILEIFDKLEEIAADEGR